MPWTFTIATLLKCEPRKSHESAPLGTRTCTVVTENELLLCGQSSPCNGNFTHHRYGTCESKSSCKIVRICVDWGKNGLVQNFLNIVEGVVMLFRATRAFFTVQAHVRSINRNVCVVSSKIRINEVMHSKILMISLKLGNKVNKLP
jgi:hypothetical protein